MNCHDFQAVIGADPSSQDPKVLAHVHECAECTRYRQQMQDMDRLIARALAVQVDASITSGEPPRTAAARSSRPRLFGGWQIAASLVASVTIAASIWVASTRDSFAEQIVAHTHHEAFTILRTDEQVDAQSLSDVLARSGLSLRADALHVSYASICLFRGQEIPHLVVQTEEGPVTVLVLADEKPTNTMQRFDEGGYEGVIVPAPRGVLAVLGKDVPVEHTVEQVLGAVEYR